MKILIRDAYQLLEGLSGPIPGLNNVIFKSNSAIFYDHHDKVILKMESNSICYVYTLYASIDGKKHQAFDTTEAIEMIQRYCIHSLCNVVRESLNKDIEVIVEHVTDDCGMYRLTCGDKYVNMYIVGQKTYWWYNPTTRANVYCTGPQDIVDKINAYLGDKE